jgi:hypothetical protein
VSNARPSAPPAGDAKSLVLRPQALAEGREARRRRAGFFRGVIIIVLVVFDHVRVTFCLSGGLLDSDRRTTHLIQIFYCL